MMMHTAALRATRWSVPAMLILLALIPSIAGVLRVADLAHGGPITSENARFHHMPLPVLFHVLAVVPYGILGALQFSSPMRQRWPHWHRTLGWVLLPLAVTTAVSGLWLTLAYPWPDADGIAVYVMRLFAGGGMLVAVALGVEAIRTRRFAGHGAWMTRAYAIAMGAGTQVIMHLPWFVLVGEPTEGPRAVMMGLGWGINVVMAEWVIQRGVGGLRAPPATPHASPSR